MSRNVCFLVSEHPFLDARIFKKEAKSLMKQGYKITMVVPRQNGFLFDVDGNVFKDSFLTQTFMYQGIKVVTYEQMSLEKNIKTLHHNLRKDSSRFTNQLTKLGVEQNADIYHAHEFLSLYSGIEIKRALRKKGKSCKLIYDSHEMEPDPFISQSLNIKKIKMQMLQSMLKEIDYVITVSESIKAWYLSLNRQLSVQVIYNSPPFTTEFVPEKGSKSEIVLGYVGMISKQRGSFQKLVKILEMSNKKLKLKVKIIGGVKKSSGDYTLSIPSYLKEKVHETGWINYDLIPMEMKDVDIGWIDVDAAHSLNNRYSMPNKFFSYLNSGVPVIVNQCTDMERFIETYQCGYVVKKQTANAQDYFHALQYLHSNRNKISNMSIQARKIMKTKFSWEHMEKHLFSIYRKLGKELEKNG